MRGGYLVGADGLVFVGIEVDGYLEHGGSAHFDGPVEHVVPLEVAVVVVEDDLAVLVLAGHEVLGEVDFASGFFLEGVDGGDEHAGVECVGLCIAGAVAGGNGDAFDVAGVDLEVFAALADEFAGGGAEGDVGSFAGGAGDADGAGVVEDDVAGIACGGELGEVVVMLGDGTGGLVIGEAVGVEIGGGHNHGQVVGCVSVLDGELKTVDDGLR